MTSTLNAVPGGSFSYDNNDRLSVDTFDANGNTTVSGGITNTYDFENRLLTHGSVTIVYDGDGNRVSETAGGVTTKFLVDTLNPTGLPQVLDEKVSGSVTRTYAYGLQRISENQQISGTWTPSFYGYDGHGNVRLLTNTAGAATDTYQFDAFGMPIASTGTTGNNFKYSDEWLDGNISLYHLRARYFNPATGRFTTMDPYEGSIRRPATLQRYVYTRNDPIDLIDPTGKQVIVQYLVVTTVHFVLVPVPVEPLPPYRPFDPIGQTIKYSPEIAHVFHYGEKAYQSYELGNCQRKAYMALDTDFGLLFDRQLDNGAEAGRDVVNALEACYVKAAVPLVLRPLLPPLPGD